MDINAAQSYAAQVYSQKTYGARTDGEGEPKTSSAAPSSSAAAQAQTNANTVTGTTGSRLSAETVGYAIQASQQVEGATASELAASVQHGLDDIASDPGYAEKQVNDMVRGDAYVFAIAPKNGAPDSEWAAFSAKLSSQLTEAEQVKHQRSTYAESLKAEGLPPADIYAKLLQFNANQSESYAESQGQSDAATWLNAQKSSSSYLQNAIVQFDSTASETGYTLPSAYQHQIEDIVSDPSYAARKAKEWGTIPTGLLIRLPPGVTVSYSGPGPVSAEDNAILNKYLLNDPSIGIRHGIVDPVEAKLKAAYQDNMAQGKSGVETYLNMLELQVSQPQEYWDAIDPYSPVPKEIAQGKLNLLRQLMAQDNSNPSDVTGQRHTAVT